MAFVALYQGERVSPHEVPKHADNRSEPPVCPICDERMYVRGGPGTEYIMHFVHNPDEADLYGCSGESSEHREMKEALIYYFSKRFGMDSVFIDEEMKVDTDGETEYRQADVLCRFEERLKPYADGIIGEAQAFNESKDTEQVEREYLDSGYSVCWIEPSDIVGRRLNEEPEIQTVYDHQMTMQTIGYEQYMPDIESNANAVIPFDWFQPALKRAWQHGRNIDRYRIPGSTMERIQSFRAVWNATVDGEAEVRLLERYIDANQDIAHELPWEEVSEEVET